MAFFLPVFFCEIHQKLLKSRSVCNCRRRRTNDLAISIFQFGGASGSPKYDASVMPGAPIFGFWNLLTCSSILGPVANPLWAWWVPGSVASSSCKPSTVLSMCGSSCNPQSKFQRWHLWPWNWIWPILRSVSLVWHCCQVKDHNVAWSKAGKLVGAKAQAMEKNN